MIIPNVKLIISFSLLVISFNCFAQVGGTDDPATDGRTGSGLIITGVPFLLIAPDARSGAMGDVGAALSPDANSTHWNPAKLAFVESKNGI